MTFVMRCLSCGVDSGNIGLWSNNDAIIEVLADFLLDHQEHEMKFTKIEEESAVGGPTG